jgi:hypothetical protein
MVEAWSYFCCRTLKSKLFQRCGWAQWAQWVYNFASTSMIEKEHICVKSAELVGQKRHIEGNMKKFGLWALICQSDCPPDRSMYEPMSQAKTEKYKKGWSLNPIQSSHTCIILVLWSLICQSALGDLLVNPKRLTEKCQKPTNNLLELWALNCHSAFNFPNSLKVGNWDQKNQRRQNGF